MHANEAFRVSPGWGVLLADLGLDGRNVLRRAGLPGDLFSGGDRMLPAAEYFALCQAAEDEAGDANMPLRIGEALTVEVFDPPLFAALCSENLDQAALRIARYKSLIGPMTLGVERTAAALTLEVRWPSHLRPPRVLDLAELVFWVALVRLATRAPVRAMAVTHPEPPEDAGAYRDWLGAPVTRGPTRSVAFSARDATRPFLTANEGMWDFFEPELRRRLSELEAGASFAQRVRATLLELLPVGEAGMGAVARRLHVSTRTLQRRLRDEGGTFQSVLSGTREDLARHYLATSALSAPEIAFLLGYEDPNSFYRAFRSWTGQTPEGARLAAS